MAKSEKKNEIAPAMPDQMPEWMSSADVPMGTDDLSQFITPPRVKVIQPMTQPPLSDRFRPGEVIVVPQVVPIAGMTDGKNGEPFYFVPLLFFPEWLVLNPWNMRTSLRYVRERSQDPGSEIAKRSRDSNLWTAECPEDPKEEIRYAEALNFIAVIIGNDDLAGLPVVMTFAKAAHRSGSNLAALIKMRRAPIYGCQFCGRVSQKSNDKGVFYTIDVTNPPAESGVTPYVMDQAFFEYLKSSHVELDDARRSSSIKVDYEDEVMQEVSRESDEY